jgi:hypothetical protein
MHIIWKGKHFDAKSISKLGSEIQIKFETLKTKKENSLK